MKDRRNKLLRSIGFAMILAGTILITGRLLDAPYGDRWNWANQTGMELVHKYTGQYEVCFLGTSTVISNISNQELFEQYGMAGVSVGEPRQPLFLTKYTLEEVLKFQSPKVIVLDTKSLFYTDGAIKDDIVHEADTIVHNTVDTLYLPWIKLAALQQTKQYDPEINYKEYFCSLYYNHENWRELGEEYFIGSKDPIVMNGNAGYTGIMEGRADPQTWYVKEEEVISAESRKELAEMKALCDKAGCALLLATCYTYFTEAEHVQVLELAESLDVDYIDMNETAGRDFLNIPTDYYDRIHFNVLGAVKWSDYLGSYLISTYGTEDKSNLAEYKRYEKQKDRFHENLKHVNDKIRLLKVTTFRSYLKEMLEMDWEHRTAFLAIRDDGTVSLDGQDLELLKELGFREDLQETFRYGYVAVKTGEGVEESYGKEEPAALEGIISRVVYRISSSGFYGGANASIMIDGEEQAQNGVGIYIVIYDNELNQVISSVFFDTFTNENS